MLSVDFLALLCWLGPNLGFAFASIGAAVIFPILRGNPRLGAALCFTAHLFAYSAAAVFSWSIFNILGWQ